MRPAQTVRNFTYARIISNSLLIFFVFSINTDITAWNDYLDNEILISAVLTGNERLRAVNEMKLLYERFLAAFPVIPGLLGYQFRYFDCCL